jgi:S1-C subfamily serine protease
MAASQNPLLGWPEIYGFSIYGPGPAYVVHVEPDSISATAGIRVGDRIIEIDGRDVTTLSAEAIKLIAKNGKSNPPAISVQSYCKEIELVPDLSIVKSSGANPFGMSVRGDMPVLVEHAIEPSPAHAAGMRTGNALIQFYSILLQSGRVSHNTITQILLFLLLLLLLLLLTIIIISFCCMLLLRRHYSRNE